MLHDPPHHTTGEKVAAVLAAAATAAQKRVRSEPIGAAYDALKNAVSATARNEVEALEAAPHSRGRRMVVAEIVETQPAEDKKIFDDLANVLAARLHDHGLPVVVNTTGTSKWHTRVLSFGVLLLLSVAFGWIIEHLISDDERHTLVALQEELLDVVHSLTPWALASTFYEVFETTPVMPELPRLTSRQIDECANPLRYPEGRECLRDCYYSNGGFHRANAVSRKVPSQAVITPLNLCRLNCFESFSYKLFDLIGQAENPETCMSRCTYPPELLPFPSDECFQFCREALQQPCSSESGRLSYWGVRFPQLIVDPPLRSFFTTLESTYFKSTTTTIIFWVQLGLSMLAAITFGYFFLDESEGHIAIMLLEVVVGLPFLLITAIILAIPMWLVIWLGIKVFGAFLSVGGLLAYACTYGAGVKLFVEKILDIHFHRAAEKLAHGASIRIFRG